MGGWGGVGALQLIGRLLDDHTIRPVLPRSYPPCPARPLPCSLQYGMIDAISHLIHRDYEAIVEDFVVLQFIPPGTDLKPILPVLAKVFDQALAGGGAKGINFQVGSVGSVVPVDRWGRLVMGPALVWQKTGQALPAPCS